MSFITKEPWKIVEPTQVSEPFIIVDRNNVVMATCINRETAVRVIACINWCECIETGVLENDQTGSVAILQKFERLGALLMKRNIAQGQLLDTLKGARAEIQASGEAEGVFFGDDVSILKKIDAVIAAIEGAK